MTGTAEPNSLPAQSALDGQLEIPRRVVTRRDLSAAWRVWDETASQAGRSEQDLIRVSCQRIVGHSLDVVIRFLSEFLAKTCSRSNTYSNKYWFIGFKDRINDLYR